MKRHAVAPGGPPEGHSQAREDRREKEVTRRTDKVEIVRGEVLCTCDPLKV